MQPIEGEANYELWACPIGLREFYLIMNYDSLPYNLITLKPYNRAFSLRTQELKNLETYKLKYALCKFVILY